MAENKNGLNETVFGWFKRVHPKELWAVNDMPQTITFDDVRKSMESGFGMGEGMGNQVCVFTAHT